MNYTYDIPFNKNWTRTKSDQDYLNTDIKQSTTPLEYSLDPIFSRQCKPCLVTDVGWIGKQGISYDPNKPMVDTESDLRNITRPLSKDPRHKYKPNCINENCVGVINGCDECQPKLYNFPECELKYSSTRLGNPSCNLRGTGVNRFQPLCLNPQNPNRWEHPGEVGINYRMIVKDNHVPCIPHPIDQTPALPPGGDLPCTPTYPTCNAPIYGLHNYRNQTEAMRINNYKN